MTPNKKYFNHNIYLKKRKSKFLAASIYCEQKGQILKQIEVERHLDCLRKVISQIK